MRLYILRNAEHKSVEVPQISVPEKHYMNSASVINSLMRNLSHCASMILRGIMMILLPVCEELWSAGGLKNIQNSTGFRP